MKGDLDGSCMQFFVVHAACIRQKLYTTLHHIALYVDIFRVVCVCRKDVVG